jgi:uncharacterized protein
MNLIWLAFITGLTSGGVSCLAVQGGLLTSATGQNIKNGESNKLSYIPVTTFLIAKFLSHLLLGIILGLLGTAFIFSPKILGSLQILAGIFMILTAARLADLHPIFRYFVIQPPKFIFRLMRNTAKTQSLFAPAILGFLSILMPCGITQAMMATAVSTGSPMLGGLVMGAFVLGTSPIFLLLGSAVVALLKRKAFAYVAAIIVMIFGLMSVNGGLVARGSIYTMQNFYQAAVGPSAISRQPSEKDIITAKIVGGKQEVLVTVTNNGYRSDVKALKVGIPVRLTVMTNNVHSCARAFTIPEFNISKVMPVTGSEVIEFTPTKTGRLAYTCSMGMYSGEFTVE